MIKIESNTLEEAYELAAQRLECSVTQLHVEVVQHPKKGFLNLFGKKAIIVATCKSVTAPLEEAEKPEQERMVADGLEEVEIPEEDEGYLESYEQEEEFVEAPAQDDALLAEIEREINTLFAQLCFDIEPIIVRMYDEETLYVEFNGQDAALLIGKEGYRYKALSYMIFNWINVKYGLQLRLEIAEFLTNQEEAIERYLESVCEYVDRDGRAHTKVLDGVLVKIALRKLRERYPQKYVAIRTTRDGAKYIIINEYH